VNHSPRHRTVLFDHDGGVDDILSLMMLLAMPHLKLAGVVVTPADCFLRPAVSASLKVLRFFNRLDIELSEGRLYGVNPFPRAWRAHAYAIDALPILNELKQLEEGATEEPGLPPQLPLPAYRGSGLSADQPGPDIFKVLQKRIYKKVIADLAPAMDLVGLDHARDAVKERFIKVLTRENIVLSRTEQDRLFEAVLAEVLDKMAKLWARPVPEPGHKFLARKIREAAEPVTVLITGPVSNLAAALAAEPALAAKIEEVVWMGGALNVEGNVRDYEHDGSAEWNAYWDPPATYRLWQFEAPLTIFPLDATNQVRVSMEFLHQLAQQRKYPLSDLAGQCWALTVGVIPAYEYVYHMWDTLTTGYLGAPGYIQFRQVRTEVIPQGPSAGRIQEVSQGGKVIQAAETVQVEKFYDYLLELFRR